MTMLVLQVQIEKTRKARMLLRVLVHRQTKDACKVLGEAEDEPVGADGGDAA